MKHFDADKPIQTSNQDLLGRSQYANAIAKAIINQEGDDSHVIGLYGQWGSGKTSTLNLVAEAITETEDDKNCTPHVIMFSSWGSDSIAQLLNRFCNAIQETNRLSKTKNSFKHLIKLLSDYGSLLTDIAPQISSVANIAGKFFGKSNNLIEIKNKIGNILKEQKRKIVVIIDDVDRLPDDQIRHVFQFVNTVADFPNVVYILPFDYSIVTTALSGVQGTDGASYMHKVIQVPLVLPDPQPGSLLDLLGDEIETLFNKNRDDFSQERIRQVTSSLIIPYLNTPRDVRRVQNVFRFQISILGENLNSIDTLGLSALIAFDPLLYNWVKMNKSLLLNPQYGETPADRKAAINDSLISYGYLKTSTEQTQKTLKCLFPSIDGSFSINKHSAWRERRVCHEDIFELYFACRIIDPLPQRSVSDALYAEDINSLNLASNLAISTNSFDSYLEEINSRLNKVQGNFAAQLATMLLSKLSANPKLFDKYGFLTPSTNDRISYIVRSLFSIIGKGKSYDVLSEAIKKMNADALAAFASELNYEERAHGQLAVESVEPDKQYLTPAGLRSVESIFLERVQKLSREPEFIMTSNLAMLIYLWLYYDEAGCKCYWDNAFNENPLSICYFIATNSGQWSSSNNQYGWTFSKEIMEPILPREIAIKKIDELRNTNALSNLDTDTLLKTIIYYLDGYSYLGSEKTSITIAQNLIPSWTR